MNYKEKTIKLRGRLEALRGQRDYIVNLKNIAEKALEEHKRELENCANAREIIRTVALQTQTQLSFHLENVVTSALETVFSIPYKFKIEFVTQRNKTECVLSLEDPEGNVVSPMSSCGGGVVDVCSFALRVAIWSIMKPKSRPVLILDEPFRYLSRDLLDNAGQMLKELTEKLEVQVLMVSHEKSLIDMADKVVLVKKNSKGESEINEG